MAVIYGTIEIDGRLLAQVKSDRGKYIVDSEGRYYADAVYPAGDSRTFTESEINIDDEVPRVRTFSKLRIVAALTRAGVWANVKQYIEQAGLYDLYLAAQDLREDNEYFAQGRTQLQTALGWTDEQVEAVLAQAVAGGGN